MYMAIAKTASRIVAFKAARMKESIMEDQDELIIRKPDCEDVALEANNNYISPIKKMTRKIRRLTSAELWSTSKL